MSWSNNPTAFIQTVEENLTALQKKIATDALTAVVMQSPVDTGQFRASHRVSVGRADMSYIETAKDKSGGNTISNGNAQLQSLVPYTTVYIQTNCPYATKIERGGFTKKPATIKIIGGYSRQAPHGVYALSFQLVKAKYT